MEEGIVGLNWEQRFAILWSKNWRKAEARFWGAMELGKTGGDLRDRRLSRADQSLRGWLVQDLMRLRK